MSTNSTTKRSKAKKSATQQVLPEAEYKAIKAAERLEMQAYMDKIKASDDPMLLYRDRDGITDIKDMLEASVRARGDNPMFYQKFKNNEPFKAISYNEVLADVNALGTALIELGLKGKHIGIIGKNCYEWCESYLAVVCGTGVAVPLDKELNAEELEQLTVKGELSAVITMDSEYNTFKAIKDSGKTDLKYVINVGMQQDENVKAGLLSWYKLREHGRELVSQGDRSFIDAQIINTDMTVILFTSGTTGTSKGVMLSHKNICFDIMVAQVQLEVRPEDVFFSVLPIHHTYECTCTFIEGIYCGASIAFCRGLKYLLKDMQEVRPTIFLAVPLIYENFYNKITRQIKQSGKSKQLNMIFKLNKATKKIGLDVAKMATKQITDTFGGRMRTLIAGGAPIDAPILKFFNNLGFTMVQGYGLTETAPMVALTPDKAEFMRPGTAGRVLEYLECKIKDPDEDGIGEICFRGPNIMLGYYKDQERTDEVLVDGWFYTGDLGYLDDDNFVYITGRKKNVIITANGKNVFPEELEFYLCRSEYIEECMVWGDEQNKDPLKRGIYATIKASDEAIHEALGKDATDEQIEEFVQREVDKINEGLPLFKRVNHIVMRNRDFDKTTGHKIKRFVDDNKKQ